MKRISIIFMLAGFLLATPLFAQDVYRWKDDEGKTHYGRTLPPEYANKPHEVLNSAGVVIRRVDDPLAEQQPKEPEKEVEDEDQGLEPLFTEDEVRIRTDRLLMLRYHSEDELIKAMETEVDQLAYDIRLNTQSQEGTMTALVGQVAIAADRQRAGLEDDPELASKVNKLRRDLRMIDRNLAAIEIREGEIRAEFEKDLVRYRFLRDGGREGALIPD